MFNTTMLFVLGALSVVSGIAFSTLRGRTVPRLLDLVLGTAFIVSLYVVGYEGPELLFSLI